MNDKMKCACCGKLLEGQFCEYCGFMNIVALDKKAEEENIIEAKAHRKERIEQITDISIVGYQYGWKEDERKYDLLRTTRIKLADGKQCDDTLFWNSQDFGQSAGESPKERTIELAYKFNGNEKKLKCAVTPVKCNDFWHIGLRITEQLKLIVCLGREDNYAESKPIDLVLN